MNVAQAADSKFHKELNAGTAALILLSIVEQAPQALYGYQIAKQLYARGERAPLMKQGVLYPVLRSLERMGLLESEVEPSVSGPPRRYYRITGEGREALVRWEGIWTETKAFVDSIMKGSGNG